MLEKWHRRIPPTRRSFPVITAPPYLLPMASHDCFYHSLTTCLGELDNEDIQVTITDDATGLIEVSYQGRTGTTEFSTTDDGATCVTDLRLT